MKKSEHFGVALTPLGGGWVSRYSVFTAWAVALTMPATRKVLAHNRPFLSAFGFGVFRQVIGGTTPYGLPIHRIFHTAILSGGKFIFFFLNLAHFD